MITIAFPWRGLSRAALPGRSAEAPDGMSQRAQPTAVDGFEPVNGEAENALRFRASGPRTTPQRDAEHPVWLLPVSAHEDHVPAAGRPGATGAQ